MISLPAGMTAKPAKMTLIVALAAAVMLSGTSTAHAIGNGVPDGDAHPNVGMLAVEFGGDRFPVCSGSYAGEREGGTGNGIFLTAGHCLIEFQIEQVPAAALAVTFDPDASVDPETSVVTAANWHLAAEFAVHPGFFPRPSNRNDYGVVVLAETVEVPAIELPTADLLDELSARGRLRPRTVFDNVGYGVVPHFKQGPPRLAPPEGRMRSTSRFQALTQSWLRLLMTAEAGAGNGGSCFGDSGSPKFVHGTNLAVAITGGGDPLCRAQSYNPRLDVPTAREFLAAYLPLP